MTLKLLRWKFMLTELHGLHGMSSPRSRNHQDDTKIVMLKIYAEELYGLHEMSSKFRRNVNVFSTFPLHNYCHFRLRFLHLSTESSSTPHDSCCGTKCTTHDDANNGFTFIAIIATRTPRAHSLDTRDYPNRTSYIKPRATRSLSDCLHNTTLHQRSLCPPQHSARTQ